MTLPRRLCVVSFIMNNKYPRKSHRVASKTNLVSVTRCPSNKGPLFSGAYWPQLLGIALFYKHGPDALKTRQCFYLSRIKTLLPLFSYRVINQTDMMDESLAFSFMYEPGRTKKGLLNGRDRHHQRFKNEGESSNRSARFFFEEMPAIHGSVEMPYQCSWSSV